MDPITALHNAARRYCIDRSAVWQQEYSKLREQGRDQIKMDDGSWKYSAAAYQLFPRYNLLNALLQEVERFIPEDFSSLEEAVTFLATAGQTANNEFTRIHNETEATAILQEREAYVAHINSVSISQCQSTTRLPFRHILADKTARDLFAKFEERWGKWYGGYVTPPAAISAHITLHTQAMETPNSYEILRRSIANTGVSRLFELREWGHSTELDLAAASFTYTGAEGFWFTEDLSWMVYASHESSITFGGESLINEMRKALPEFERYIYKNWALEDY